MSKQTKIPKPNNSRSAAIPDLGHSATDEIGSSEKSRSKSGFLGKLKENGLPAHRLKLFKDSNQQPSKKRDPDGFKIYGLPRAKRQRQNTIYFDNGSDDVSVDQFERIKNFMAANAGAKTIYLYGLASEEGRKKENDLLIQQRLAAVFHLAEMYSGVNVKFKRIARPEESAGHYDYRQYRSVKMSTAPLTFSKLKKASEGRECYAAEKQQITASKNRAKTNLRKTISLLLRFLADPTENAAISEKIITFFGSDDREVVLQMINIYTSILYELNTDALKDKTVCGDETYKTCQTAYAATLSQTGMIFCNKFFAQNEATLKERILIHEMAHFIPQNMVDVAYAHDRLFRLTTTEEALRNADTYAYFVLEINNLKAVSKRNTMDTPIKDQYINCDEENRQKDLEDTLARTALSYGLAATGLRRAYNRPAKLSEMREYIEKGFGTINKVKLAGIIDRMAKLKKLTFYNTFTFKCLLDTADAGKGEIIALNKGGQISVRPAFTKLSKLKQISLMAGVLAGLEPDIPKKHQSAYGELTTDYVKYNWEY